MKLINVHIKPGKKGEASNFIECRNKQRFMHDRLVLTKYIFVDFYLNGNISMRKKKSQIV